MKTFKITLLAIAFVVSFSACDEQSQETVKPTVNAIGDPAALDLVGTSYEGATMSVEEFNSQFNINNQSANVSCSLGSDVGCSEASEDMEYFILNCTLYERQIPIGTINTSVFYRSISYYVDSDSDINLDQYEDDLQDIVTSVTPNGAVLVIGDVIYRTCNDREDNSAVILLTVLTV